MTQRHKIYLSLLALLTLAACASTPKEESDPRLVVDTVMMRSGDESRAVAFVTYSVRISNVSSGTVFIRRVEVEPVGGGSVRNASTTANKRLEPGEIAEFRIIAEVVGDILGVGQNLAKVFVAFDAGEERVLASYLVNL